MPGAQSAVNESPSNRLTVSDELFELRGLSSPMLLVGETGATTPCPSMLLTLGELGGVGSSSPSRGASKNPRSVGGRWCRGIEGSWVVRKRCGDEVDEEGSEVEASEEGTEDEELDEVGERTIVGRGGEATSARLTGLVGAPKPECRA